MNLSLALPDALREVSIDGVPYVLVRRSALDALYPGPAITPTRSPAARVASPQPPRPAAKKLKAAASRSPATRAAAAPHPEVSKPKPVSGALRSAVLAAIQESPGQTSLEIFDTIRQKFPTTTSGSCYQSIKSWVKARLVEGKQTDEGTIGWHPRAASKAIFSAA